MQKTRLQLRTPPGDVSAVFRVRHIDRYSHGANDKQDTADGGVGGAPGARIQPRARPAEAPDAAAGWRLLTRAHGEGVEPSLAPHAGLAHGWSSLAAVQGQGGCPPRRDVLTPRDLGHLPPCSTFPGGEALNADVHACVSAHLDS